MSFITYFLTVKGKKLGHTLEHSYHRKIFRQFFSAFLLMFLRGRNIEAQQLRLLASRPIQV